MHRKLLIIGIKVHSAIGMTSLILYKQDQVNKCHYQYFVKEHALKSKLNPVDFHSSTDYITKPGNNTK